MKQPTPRGHPTKDARDKLEQVEDAAALLDSAADSLDHIEAIRLPLLRIELDDMIEPTEVELKNALQKVNEAMALLHTLSENLSRERRR